MCNYVIAWMQLSDYTRAQIGEMYTGRFGVLLTLP